MNKILFLCTGNYYRSRFAEYLFNAIADQQGLNWWADSRGLALELGKYNVGAIAHQTVQKLAEFGITVPHNERFPLQALEADFITAHKIVALDESEHRPMIAERFPHWIEQVEYWLIHDVHKTPAESALQQIEQQVQQLIEQIGIRHEL